MTHLFIIGLAGSIGAVSRYLIGNFAALKFGSAFPYGTFIVNIIGCFIMGLFMIMINEHILENPYWRFVVTVGFLGSLTTFSSFSYETIKLFTDANYLYAFYNLSGNLILGFLATIIGIYTAKLFA